MPFQDHNLFPDCLLMFYTVLHSDTFDVGMVNLDIYDISPDNRMTVFTCMA